MKKITFGILAIVAISFSAQSQENKTVKEVSTVKRVVKREGSKVMIQEVEEVEQEKGAVIVAGNEKENQTFSEDIKKTDDKNVLVDQTITDEQNEALIAAQKNRLKEEMAASIAAAKAKAEAQRKLLAEKEEERLAAVAKYQKNLQKRSKGTGKLKKKKKHRN